MDAFKALALGATAVSVGRTLMNSLSEGAAPDVQKKINDMTQELAAAMARTCSRDLSHIDPAVIWTKNGNPLII